MNFFSNNIIKILIFIISLFLIGTFFFILNLSSQDASIKEQKYLETILNSETLVKEEIVESLEETLISEESIVEPLFFFSATELKQGDTLIIFAENISKEDKIIGKFNNQLFDFFPIETLGKKVALVGIDAKKIPGDYLVSIFLADELIVEKTIKVEKSDFYITKIVIAPELEEKGFTSSNISENISTEDGVIIYEITRGYSPQAYFNESFVYPLDKIINVGAFGNIRKDNGVTIQHLGVDLDAAEGTSIYAINNGKVVFVDELTVFGKTVIIDHGLGIYSLYLHLFEFNTFEGEMVSRGEVIGFSGNTGWSNGPHLHLSIKINGASIDPLKFIDNFGILLENK
jgi:murein DD-endopeptidase MepM/ murein hydrolase activator NlpD